MQETKGLVRGPLWGEIHSIVACCNQVLFCSDSSALVYRGLSFPWQSFPLPITPSPLSFSLSQSFAFLSLLLSLSHLALPLSASPLSLRVLTRIVPATRSYQRLLSCRSSLFSSAQIHLFYHHSYLSIYTGLRGRNCSSIWAMLCVISCTHLGDRIYAKPIFSLNLLLPLPKWMVIYVCLPFHPHYPTKQPTLKKGVVIDK